ncbi:MAG: PepSY domain-containing protein [Hyphomicrobiaceae bacterium]
MRIMIAIAAIIVSSPAFAGPHCTSQPESNWLTKTEMMERIKPLGHKIQVFKKTSGNCYEIYGKDKSGRRIEVYFHPVTGAIVKSSAL